MALDDVVKTTITGPRIEEAMYRMLRWIDRCIAGNYVIEVYHLSLWLFPMLNIMDIPSVNSAQETSRSELVWYCTRWFRS